MLMETDKRMALQAYEQILNLILDGRADPGGTISERGLTEMLNMSRTPVRDALLMLEGEGLLVRQGTRGLQVKQTRLDDYMDTLQVRKMIEPEAARLASGRMPAAVIDGLMETLNGLLDEARNGREKPDRGLVRSVDDGIHGGIAEAAGNSQLAQIILTLRRKTQIFDLRSVPERLEATCLEHIAILDALRDGRAEDAAIAMRAHLNGVRDSIIRRLTRT
jgi:DNA-binding GntR family transcriptional regulator